MNLETLIEDIYSINLGKFFAYWEKQKDIFIVKHDGQRSDNKFTFVIIGNDSRFDTIRLDCNDFYCGLEEVLQEYIGVLKKIAKSDSSS